MRLLTWITPAWYCDLPRLDSDMLTLSNCGNGRSSWLRGMRRARREACRRSGCRRTGSARSASSRSRSPERQVPRIELVDVDVAGRWSGGGRSSRCRRRCRSGCRPARAACRTSTGARTAPSCSDRRTMIAELTPDSMPSELPDDRRSGRRERIVDRGDRDRRVLLQRGGRRIARPSCWRRMPTAPRTGRSRRAPPSSSFML